MSARSPSSPAVAGPGPGPGQVRGVFIGGFGSGAGKSTVSMCLIDFLLARGHVADPDEIAYIKPVTQCEAVTDVAEYCRAHQIPNVPIGPVVFRRGLTAEVIMSDEEQPEAYSARMLADISRAVQQLSDGGRRFVVVDGVGYPSVGACCGVCNAAVAAALALPVLLVAPRGLGDAIDTFVLMHSYFASRGAHVAGVLFNRVADSERHKVADASPAVRRFVDRFTAASSPVSVSPSAAARIVSPVPDAPLDRAPPLQLVGFLPEMRDLPPFIVGDPLRLASAPDFENAQRFSALTQSFAAAVDDGALRIALRL